MNRSLPALGLLVACLALPTTGPAAAAEGAVPRGLDPVQLTRGPAPAVTWLGGRTIHTANGHAYTLPASVGDPAHLRLLGRSRQSWIVADLGPERALTTRVVAVHRQRVREVASVPTYYDRPTYQLSRHGDLVTAVDHDRGGSTATVWDLDGDVVGQRYWYRFAQLLDAAGDEVVLGVGKTLRWQPGSPPVQVAKGAILASIDQDLLFVVVDGKAGPTSLSAPGTPAWTQPFVARAVSPDGLWVAGYEPKSIYTRVRRLEVRSMADGSLQPTTGLLLRPNAALGWDADGQLLAGVHSARGNALVRCGVDGQCERATGWLPDQSITLPYSPEFFFDWP